MQRGNMARKYYVVKVDGSWGVKLEGGRYIDRDAGGFKQAKRRAIRLGLNNRRGVVINDADGFTRKNMSFDEVRDKYGNKRWTPSV